MRNEEIRTWILIALKASPVETLIRDAISWVESVMPSATKEEIRKALLTLIDDGKVELTKDLGLQLLPNKPTAHTTKVLQLKLLNSTIEPPGYMTAGSAGLDLCSAEPNTIKLSPRQSVAFNTGIALFIEDPNYAGLVLPRSSLGHKHGIILSNSVGLIDSDYQGEIKVSLRNTSDDDYNVRPGDRIAQLVIIPVLQTLFTLVDEFSVTTKRGVGGFGSTGI